MKLFCFIFRINCTIPGIESVVPSNQMPECQSKEAAIESSNELTRCDLTILCKVLKTGVLTI